MIRPEQVRAARALLGWSARELAARAGVHLRTVQRLERREGAAPRGTIATLARVHNALTGAGIVFLDGEGEGIGVRLCGRTARGGAPVHPR